MELYKIITFKDKVYIKMLVYNERVWSNRQWSYHYVRINDYPTNEEKYATDFKNIFAAEEWIKENGPIS